MEVLLPHTAEVMWRVLGPSPCTGAPGDLLRSFVSGCWTSGFLCGQTCWRAQIRFLQCVWKLGGGGMGIASNSCITLKINTSFLAQLFEKWSLFPLLFYSQYLYFLSTSLPVTYPLLPWLKAEINSVCVDCAGSFKLHIPILEKDPKWSVLGSKQQGGGKAGREGLLDWLTKQLVKNSVIQPPPAARAMSTELLSGSPWLFLSDGKLNRGVNVDTQCWGMKKKSRFRKLQLQVAVLQLVDSLHWDLKLFRWLVMFNF